MDDKFVNGTMLNNFAKKLKSNIKSDLLGDKKLRYLTQSEYDALTDNEKSDQTIIYNITDVNIEEEFSGDYNDLENRPCYDDIKSIECTYDGNATGRVVATDPFETMVKVSDEVIDYETYLKSVVGIHYPDGIQYHKISDKIEGEDYFLTKSKDMIWGGNVTVIYEDNVELWGAIFPERGIYFHDASLRIGYNDPSYTCSFIAEIGGELKQLDEKFIPDTIATKEYVDDVAASKDYVDDTKQDILVSGENIKTINGESILGSGDISIESGGSTGSASAINYDLNIKAVNHRGYSKGAPENTIPAYIMSKEKGYTYVECDVSFTKDSVAVLLHDDTIDRTSNGSGSIESFTYEELLQYDFGSWYSSKFTGTTIPTFKEFMMYCKGLGMRPYIELKPSGGYTESQIRQVVDEVKLCGMKGKVTYISFSSTFLQYVKNYDEEARLGFIADVTSSTIATANGLKTGKNEVFMDVNYTYVKDSKVALCMANDLPMEVWTVNDANTIKKLNPYISGVTSDNQMAGKILYNLYSTYTNTTYVSATSITLNKTSLTFDELKTQTLTATVSPSNASGSVVWKSSNTSVATVSNGIVTPLKDGSCTITASIDSVSASCSITIATVGNVYSVTENLTGCTSSNIAVNVVEGEAYTDTFTHTLGYTLEDATVSITMGGVDVSSYYNDGILNIPSVTGDIVVTIVAKEKIVVIHNITRNLTNCTSSSSAIELIEGESHTEIFTAPFGYTLEDATISITMGGTDASSYYNNGTLNIPSVTGDIVVTIIAKEKIVECSITRNLNGCTSSSDITKILGLQSHTETFTANEGYTMDWATVSVTMGGADISDCYVDGTLTIDSVTGDIIISIQTIDVSWKFVRTLGQDDLQLIQINKNAPSYTNSSKARVSYTAFDLFFEKGYMYKFVVQVADPSKQYNIGLQCYTEDDYERVSESSNIQNIYDPGWQELGLEMTPPTSYNNSPIKGYRITFRNTSNSNMKATDIVSVTILKKQIVYTNIIKTIEGSELVFGNLKTTKQSATGGYYVTDNTRLSYVDFDILMSTGKTYKFVWTSTIPLRIGVQSHTTSNVNSINSGGTPTLSVTDYKWHDNEYECTMLVADTGGCRIIFSDASNLSATLTGDEITQVIIYEY